MKRIIKNKIYIYDPLYGVYYLPDFIWDIITCPELQRLREVRLCNINSFCLTGGANINRYEHAIGTCYLAQECLESWPLLSPLSKREKQHFLLAALLHDVASAAFGHSVEYVESQVGFDHEKAFSHVVIGQREGAYLYKSTTLEPIFFGMPRGISSKVPEEDLKAIGEIIAGKGRFGPLINATMDLDNIDNVYRLAYHIGLVKSGEVPLGLAKSLWIENGKLTLRKEAIPLVKSWHKTRKKLYEFLLLNPQEFSAKCMLTEAIETAKAKETHPFNWYDVDYRLFEKLSQISSEISVIISRLMKGDLYACIGIFSTTKTEKYDIFSDVDSRKEIEDKLGDLIQSKFAPRFKSAMLALHAIIDINKTERQVQIETDDGVAAQIGNRSNQLLIGVFFKNVGLNIYEIDKIPREVMSQIYQVVFVYLSEVLDDKRLREVELYSEVKECQQ